MHLLGAEQIELPSSLSSLPASLNCFTPTPVVLHCATASAFHLTTIAHCPNCASPLSLQQSRVRAVPLSSLQLPPVWRFIEGSRTCTRPSASVGKFSAFSIERRVALRTKLVLLFWKLQTAALSIASTTEIDRSSAALDQRSAASRSSCWRDVSTPGTWLWFTSVSCCRNHNKFLLL